MIDYFFNTKDPLATLPTIEIDGKNRTEKEILSLLDKTINSATTLIFKSCLMTEPVIKAVLKKENLKKISFENCSELTNEQVSKITKLCKNSLEAFSVTGPSKLTEEIWNILSDVETLHSVSLSDIPVQKRNNALTSFLQSKNEQIKQLSCKLFYPTTLAEQKIELPKLEEFSWFKITNLDLEFLKKTSPKLTTLETCDLTFQETLLKVRELPLLSTFTLYKPQNISTNESSPVVGFKKQTTQINAASIDKSGFSYFVQSRDNKACLLKINMSNGDESVINTSVPHLTDSYGVMLSVKGNTAIIATPQQNERNIGNTEVTVVNTESNQTLFSPIIIPKENTIYDVQIGSFKENSQVWGYAIEINSNNTQYLVSQTKLHVFPLDNQYKQQTIPLDFFSPVEHQGAASTTFINDNEIALIAYGGSSLKSCVFCFDLAAGAISKQYVVPVNPNKIDGGFTAITRVFDRKYALAVMDARGDIYIGPALNSDHFILEASMGDVFKNATYYTSFAYVGNGIFAYYSETQYPFIANERLVGFFDIDTKKKLSEVSVQVDGNCDFYMKRLQLLDSGKLGLTIVSRYLSDANKEPTWDYTIQLEIPKKN